MNRAAIGVAAQPPHAKHAMDTESDSEAGAGVEEDEVAVVELHAEQADAAEAAVRQAEAEGLTLQPSDDNATGYRGVSSSSSSTRFCATVRRAGERVHLGYFDTAQEAALAYARTPEAQVQVANAKPVPLTAEEAVAQAAAEGLKFEPSSNAAGYKGVKGDGSRYQARVTRAGEDVYLGSFATAEEAALVFARADARNKPPAASPAAAKRAAPPPKQSSAKQPRNSAAPGPLQPDSGSEDGINVEVIEVVEVYEEDAEGEEGGEDEDEEDQEMGQADAADAAVRQAEAEGLTLQPSDNTAGYRGVYKDCRSRGKAKPFNAKVWRAGKEVHLGAFATAEEAALAFARTPEAQAQVANSKPAPLTAEQAVAQAAAEGLKLEPSSNAAGYRGVGLQDSRYNAYTPRDGGKPAVYLGSFATAEEAAMAVARAGARTDPPAASPRPAAAKRAAPPQKPPPAKLNPKANSNSEEPTVAPNPASASTASVRLEVGQSLEACFGGRGYWFPGVVQHINEDGTLAIDYDDGDQEERVLRKHVRPPKAKARPPSPLASTSSGRLRTAPQRLDASLLMASSRSCRSAGEASKGEAPALEEEADSGEELGEPATLTTEAVDRTDAAEAAVRQAAAEGLTLQPSGDNSTGYRSVRKDCRVSLPKPFYANVWRDSKAVHLGTFATAEEAALAYARTPEAQAEVANPKPAPLTAREAVAQAAAEGLTLEPSNNAAGYKRVNVHNSRYQAAVRSAGKQVHLGNFVTAEEAALAAARANARNDPHAASPAAAKRATPPPPKPSPAKQPRHAPPPRPVQPVPLRQRDAPAPQASPKLEAAAAVVAPAPVLFKHKLALIKRELCIQPATPAIPAVAEANQQMGITPSLGESLGVQLDRLLAIISS